MKTVLIQIFDHKAYKLLEYLEDMGIVKIMQVNDSSKQKLFERFAGSLHLSEDEYKAFQNHLINSRNEWERKL